MSSSPQYRRVLLKLSGEALASLESTGSGHKKFGIDPKMLEKLAQDILSVHQTGLEIALVVGGGNIYRGAQADAYPSTDRTSADHMGMLATTINGLALKSALEHYGMPVSLMSAMPIPNVCETFTRRKAVEALNKKHVLICVAGTGNPYFTTDSAAALRACELNCDLLLKATKVAGIYTADPNHHASAEFLPRLTYREVIERKLKVMDMTAITLAKENKIPIAVFSIYENNGFGKVLNKATQFTIIS
ncbi:UMP kinase [Candidatus Finniella inopinata]|uniref:Uridylate kinase n=1 Tax=Candidatus Finniella inopinata TaxID=1696036 RepID=A0A4Q7DIV0_9PROT|nr:UMP kinase [Candidatus Finniella inopinata]RZI45934.1 UMP kinase [Candidatus Finniella inopinata]